MDQLVKVKYENLKIEAKRRWRWRRYVEMWNCGNLEMVKFGIV